MMQRQVALEDQLNEQRHELAISAARLSAVPAQQLKITHVELSTIDACHIGLWLLDVSHKTHNDKEFVIHKKSCVMYTVQLSSTSTLFSSHFDPALTTLCLTHKFRAP